MKLLKRLFAPREPHAQVRPLWHAVVACARDPHWYADLGLTDSLAGRFDAITLVLGLVLLRMERNEGLIPPSVRLTELFVSDMDGQLREAGIGDLVVGKHIGRLMSVLGGRLGAWRDGLAEGAAPEVLQQAIARNLTLLPGTRPEQLAEAARALYAQLLARDDAAIMAGNLA
jgi:cytochrome b pre-mRNA-processing protein 3